MNAPEHNLDDLLARVADGRLDELTPEQVAALEAQLEADPGAAERLADVVPASEAVLSPEIPPPSNAEWEHVWDAIESALPARALAPRASRRMFHRWRPLVAVAACVALVVLWHLTPTEFGSPRPLRMSDHVVVHELEVFGDESAFVAYSDDDAGSAVIWVFESDETQGGA